MSIKFRWHCPATVAPHLMGIKRKKMYNSKEEAIKADKNAIPYLCDSCNKWHLKSKK